MSLINKTKVSNEDRKQIASSRLRSRISHSSLATLRELASQQAKGVSLVWSHPILTPTEAVTELGKDYFVAATAHQKLTQFIVETSVEQNVSVVGQVANTSTKYPLFQAPVAEDEEDITILVKLPQFKVSSDEDGNPIVSDEVYTPTS